MKCARFTGRLPGRRPSPSQLLAFSRRQQLRPEVLDLNEWIRGVEHMLRRVLGEDKVFVLDLAEDLGHVRADRGQLEQVLLNLTLNARDAMPMGGTFTISTRNVSLPHPERRLSARRRAAFGQLRAGSA